MHYMFIFRKLADISRSTRGVVILMSDRPSSTRILEDARRLNMMDGHFVWVWIDTAAIITVKNSTTNEEEKEIINSSGREERYKRSLGKSDTSDMHVNYLLKNDQFLLFHRNYGVESSKSKDRGSHRSRSSGDAGAGNLPPGLLSLKPMPVKVDRHLVKGAVRLLTVALRLVLDKSPEWMLENLVRGRNDGCWNNNAAKESGFILEFAR